MIGLIHTKVTLRSDLYIPWLRFWFDSCVSVFKTITSIAPQPRVSGSKGGNPAMIKVALWLCEIPLSFQNKVFMYKNEKVGFSC